ncbi:unnamed protein product [Macrosiphum euphorbiae]|uniref:Uncharacterized protein n=1 Tax=Macrosiphum euphorbiae TaxID=13131 RepID=A0AAV0X8A3_9HEMI|nr:unnamed protein product [Macrosiphum euphorbiae]
MPFVFWLNIVLKGKLNNQFYSHFKLLVSALRILVCDNLCQIHNQLAETFLKEFVSQYSILYGPHNVSYNVHNLVHLPMFVKIHGSLDNFSCFKYENYLQEIKKSIKSAKYPLPEITNRIIEKQKHCLSEKYQISNPVTVGKEVSIKIVSPYVSLADKIYEKITLQDLNITINTSKIKDKYVMLKNQNIVVVRHIMKRQNEFEFKIIVQKFFNCLNFYFSPTPSSNLETFNINTALLSDEFIISVTEVKYKCFFVPISNETAIVTTLCHGIAE